MRFDDIDALNFMWLVLALVVFYIWVYNKKKSAMLDFAREELLKELSYSVSRSMQAVKHALLILAIVFGIISLARPQWGFKWQEVTRKGIDILIALDTSKSMLAEDVKPNRLERSKLAVKDLVKKLNGDRVGLIAFAGEAFLQCPLTVDYNGFILSLDDLSVETIPKGGTAIASAVYEAIKGFEAKENKYDALVIITDGEDHEGDPAQAAKEAEKNGIKIFCIGIGTQGGDLIPVTDSQGKQGFLKDAEGNVVKSRLDEEILQKMALATGGVYIRSSATEFGLDMIYEQRLSKIEKRDMETKMKKRYEERFQIPLAIVLLLVMIEPFISEKRR